MLDFRKSSIIGALRKVLIRFHYPLEVMLTCVRWYVAYPLSLRHIEEMMQERGPPTKVFEVRGVGHAPSLMAADEITVIHDFLTEHEAHPGKREDQRRGPRVGRSAPGQDQENARRASRQ